MSTPCQGCKALVVQTADDYNVYSLQRAIYPVNPLMILPQPNSWVDHVCDDGFVVHRLYTQGEDFVTFYQQILAECANHTVPADPIVISGPDTDSGGNPPPEVDPNTNTNNDPVPGPGDHVSPPLQPPPENHPDSPGPGPGPNPGGGGTWPPGQPPSFPSGQTVPPDDYQHAWLGYEFNGCLGVQDGGNDVNTIDHSGDGFFGDYLWSWLQAQYNALPDPKMLAVYEAPTWYYMTEQGPGTRHKMMIDYAQGLVWFGSEPDPTVKDQYGNNAGPVHEGLNSGYYWQLCIRATVYVRRDVIPILPP